MKTSQTISVSGMQCSGCETVIKDAVCGLPGIFKVIADYPSSQVFVNFDPGKTTLGQISTCIADKGYTVRNVTQPSNTQRFRNISFSLISLVAIIALMYGSKKWWQTLSLPELNAQAEAGLILSVGLISGLHCIGMCGNFVLNYTVRDAQLNRPLYLSHLFYGIGKTLSYALFGALFGLLGSLFKFTPFISGVTSAVAGVFLVIFGLNTLNVFSFLKRVRIKQPEAMARFAINQRRQAKSPFFIGFFSGFLLGCGPLQAMYVLAAGNGDPLQGAKFLTLFGLGTLPSLVGFGMMARLLSNAMTRRFIQASGLILIVMGLMMLDKGMLRARTGYDFVSIERGILLKTGLDKYIKLPESKMPHLGHAQCH